ncbi:sugar phosphate isomerase/epimerase family protein [Paenibacillus glufosinatiresistens]|uniref:sugar phosphate isomerase/epimerase family protein n=1 Tax=Paenibacillus glufosinatiresistens TaxID=3070657 RepID=UPI00286D73EC|nr:sugar phosphate isomerase/epimerase family protein [Paenibacillus sp. YX.27]
MLKIGLQLYTLREQLEEDFEGTLRQVAAMGYAGVEFFNYFGRSAGEVKALLDETGLVAVGAHRPYQALLNDTEAEIAYNQAIGNRRLIIPFLSEEERDWAAVIANLKIIGERVKAQGSQLLYHNHDFELLERYEEQTAFDAIYAGVPADVLQVEMDTCWVHHAGYDPVAYMAAYAGRLPIIHLKDMKKNPDGTAETVVLGEGEVDLPSILSAAETHGVEWAVVEQDFCSRSPLESVRDSMAWLKGYAGNEGQLRG